MNPGKMFPVKIGKNDLVEVVYRPDSSTCEHGHSGDESHWDLFAAVKVHHNRRLIAITTLLIALLLVCLGGTIYVIYLQNQDSELTNDTTLKVLHGSESPQALNSDKLEMKHEPKPSIDDDNIEANETQSVAIATMATFNLTEQLNQLMNLTMVTIPPLPTLPTLPIIPTFPPLFPGFPSFTTNLTQFTENLNNFTRLNFASLRLPPLINQLNPINLSEPLNFLTPPPPSPPSPPSPLPGLPVLPNIEGFPVISNEELQEIAEVNQGVNNNNYIPPESDSNEADEPIKPIPGLIPVDTTPLADIFKFLSMVFDRRSDVTSLKSDFQLNN